MIGQSIAHYRVTAKLGEGGMGIVYRASDTKLDRDVAIKVLPPEVANEPDRLARFEREAKTLASLNHPNIAAVYGVESAALIMELVEGPTLADRLNSGPIPQDEAISIAIQIAEALEAAHDKGIVHRDLKPANIKLTPSHQVKLLDFGLAKAMESTKAIPGDPINSPTIVAASMPGVIMGTAGYMSPEQAKGHPVDRRADIWSFGVVLHEMLTGQRLFDAGTIAESIADVLRRDIDLNALPTNTPPHVKTLLARCLDRNPKTRLRDIGEARIQLTTPPQPAENTPAKTHTLKWPYAAIAALALAIPAAWFLKPAPQSLPITLSLPTPNYATFNSYAAATASPDGSKFLLLGTDNKSGKAMLWLRQLHSDSFAALPSTEGAVGPCFSPDSRSIAFYADSKLKRLDLDDASLRILAEAPGNSSRPAWSERGIILYINNEGLHRIPATGGQSTIILTPKNGFETGSSSPVFLPGGEKFLYYRVTNRRSVMVSDLEGHSQPLFDNYYSSATYAEANGQGWLLYRAPGGRLLASPFDPVKTRFTGEPQLLAHPLPAGGSWSASRNGVLVYRHAREQQPATLRWRLRNGTPAEVIATEGNPRHPRISPDQKMVLFVAGIEGAEALYIAETGGGKPRKLPIPESELDAPLWSLDGQRIIYQVTDSSGTRRLIERPLNGDTPLRTVLRSDNNVLAAAFSPDGKWIAGTRVLAGTPYAVLFPADGTATEDTLLRPLPAKDPSTATGFSPDGRWLLYQMRSLGSTYSVFVRSVPPAAGGPASSLTFQVSSEVGTKPQWRADGKEIYYINPENQLLAAPVLPGTDFRTGKPVPLFEAPFDRTALRAYDVTSDGSRFVVVERNPGNSDLPPITVILNWPKLLERK